MWVQDPSQIPGGVWGAPGSPQEMDWPHAITNCEALDYAGHTDWRLPNVNEMQSIIDMGRHSPSIDPLFVCGADSYWSSTTVAAFTDYAWFVSFNNVVISSGFVSYQIKTGEYYYVRPVRGGR